MHAHDGRDVRLLHAGEHHESALDDIGPKLRSVDASGGQPVAGREVDKTTILWTFWPILWTFSAPPNYSLPLDSQMRVNGSPCPRASPSNP